MRNKKKLFILFVAGILICTTSMSGFANVGSEHKQVNIEMLANKHLTVNTSINEKGGIEKRIKNIGEFKSKLFEKNLVSDDAKAAKTIYQYLEKDIDYINKLPEEKLLEALTIEDCVETTNYIKFQENGEQIYLSEPQLIFELSHLADKTKLTGTAKNILNNPNLFNLSTTKYDNTITDSNDGYLRLKTTAYRTSGSLSGRSYYLIEAEATWLKEPFFKLEDVLAITSNAQLDNSYNNYGYYHQTTCIKSVGTGYCTYEYIDNYIYKNSGANNPDQISFEYSSGIGGIVLRFNMHEFTYSGSTGYIASYPNMQAFVRYKVSLYNSDGGVQAAYGHKQVGVGGISVSLSTGSIGLSFAGTMAKYYGEPLSIYNYK